MGQGEIAESELQRWVNMARKRIDLYWEIKGLS